MIETLKQNIKEARSRAYSLKTKKAQQKAWAHVRDLEREVLMLLYAQRDDFATHSVKGTVRWFREGEDDFAVNTPYGTLYPSPTSDDVSKSWYGHTCCVQYTEGQEVILEVTVDVDSDRLCLELIPKRIQGGVLDVSKYAELCKRDDLAFFKYPNSAGVIGLFGGAK